MGRRAAQHGLFHDHAVGANPDGAAVGGQHGAVQHATARSHPHLAAEHRGRRDVGRRIYRRDCVTVSYLHRPTVARSARRAWPPRGARIPGQAPSLRPGPSLGERVLGRDDHRVGRTAVQRRRRLAGEDPGGAAAGGQGAGERSKQLADPGLDAVLEFHGHDLVDDERVDAGQAGEMAPHRNPVLALLLRGVVVAAPDQHRFAGSLGQHPAQVLRLLALAPVGELHGGELGRVAVRPDVDDGLVGPQRPAQVQRRRHERAHVRPFRDIPEQEGYLEQPDMRTLMTAALDLGWTLWAYEAVIDVRADRDPAEFATMEFTNWREREQAQNLCRVLAEGPGEPVLVWSGNNHAAKQPGEDWVPMGCHFPGLSGIDPFVIDQIVTVEFEHGVQPWIRELLGTLAGTLAACGGTAGILTGQAPTPLDCCPADAVVVSTENALT